jgi:hypothetical protein
MLRASSILDHNLNEIIQREVQYMTTSCCWRDGPFVSVKHGLFKACKIYIINFCTCTNGFYILAGLAKRKVNIEFLLAFLKTITNNQDCSKSTLNFCSGFLSHWSIFSSIQHIHGRLTEQFSRLQLAFRTSFRQASWRGLLVNFMDAMWNFFFGCFSQKDRKILWNHQSTDNK